MDIVKEYNHDQHTKRGQDEDGGTYCPECEKINEMTDEEYIELENLKIKNYDD